MQQRIRTTHHADADRRALARDYVFFVAYLATVLDGVALIAASRAGV